MERKGPIITHKEPKTIILRWLSSIECRETKSQNSESILKKVSIHDSEQSLVHPRKLIKTE